MVQKTDSIACNEASKRVSSDAKFLDRMAFLPELFKPCLDFVGYSLATNLSAIVSEASGVALRDENVKFRISLLDAVGEVLEMVWIAPKTATVSA